ncbi:hypothetical protein OHA55_23705 [Streptomyces sp. NBC_00102]|nr:hypothetical protein [Streptomyces sp. NBC_00102]
MRQWVCGRLNHGDAQLVAHELFVAILVGLAGRSPDAIEMTISTAGSRARISATGFLPLPVPHPHGPGALIISRLSHSSGVSQDGQYLWAQLRPEVTT